MGFGAMAPRRCRRHHPGPAGPCRPTSQRARRRARSSVAPTVESRRRWLRSRDRATLTPSSTPRAPALNHQQARSRADHESRSQAGGHDGRDKQPHRASPSISYTALRFAKRNLTRGFDTRRGSPQVGAWRRRPRHSEQSVGFRRSRSICPRSSRRGNRRRSWSRPGADLVSRRAPEVRASGAETPWRAPAGSMRSWRQYGTDDA